MSYDIYIGEPTWEAGASGLGERSLTVPRVDLPEAPLFDGDQMTERGNSRHPGYGAWSEFLRNVGLYEMFLGEGGLMKEHPGIASLDEHHLQQVRIAVTRWTERRQRMVEWCQRKTFSEEFEVVMLDYCGKPPGFTEGQDPILARLLWLEWWIGWALVNCKTPAMENR